VDELIAQPECIGDREIVIGQHARLEAVRIPSILQLFHRVNVAPWQVIAIIAEGAPTGKPVRCDVRLVRGTQKGT
jgi:hypothetical protein